MGNILDWGRRTLVFCQTASGRGPAGASRILVSLVSKWSDAICPEGTLQVECTLG